MIGATILSVLGLIFIIVACLTVLGIAFLLILDAYDTLDLALSIFFFIFLLAFIVGSFLWVLGI